MSEPREERLPCGAGFGALVEQIADGAPADRTHQSVCPHCQAALDELTTLWDATQQLVAEPVDVPEGLDASVIRRIRREIFVRDAYKLLAGTLPRLGWALLTYAGLLRRSGEPSR